MRHTKTLVALCCAVLASAGSASATSKHPIRAASLIDAARIASPAERTNSAPRLDALTARLRQKLALVKSAAPRSHLTARQAAAVSALRQSVGGAVEVRMRPQFGTPMQIRGARLESALKRTSGADDDEPTARRFLGRHRALFRLKDPALELAVRKRETDTLGRRHLRFAQTYRGHPVWPAEINVHLDAAGNVDLIDGFSIATPAGVDLTPATPAADAVAAARAALHLTGDVRAAEPELIVYALARGGPRLAWRFELAAGRDVRVLAVVDATSGRLLNAIDQIAHANVAGSGDDLLDVNRPLDVFHDGDGTYFLVDISKPMFDPTSQPPRWENLRGGIVVFDARNQPPTSQTEIPDQVFYVTSNDPDAWQPPDAVSAAFNVSQTYDYYLERHGRDSIDAQRGSLYAMVRVGQGLQNAFWYGDTMHFGDAQPYAGALDVVAHEYTHGVTDFTANLLYQDQSGALDEGMSDVFGEMTEERTYGENDWLLGGDLGTPVRNMARPEDFGQPSRMRDFLFTDQDSGGVHTNSGIIGHAYYLLAEGADGAIGGRDAERIFYRALAVHLVQNSQFIDARLACIASAEELFGAGSRQASATAEAFDAVEIFDGRGTPDPPDFPPVEGVDATLSLFYDELEDAYFLARRETSLGDPSGGVKLLELAVAPARPSVSGDGSFAVFVNADHDVCFVNTDGSPIDPESDTVEECLGFDFIGSVSVAPDGEHFGFVLLDANGDPDNRIRVIDLGDGGETRTFELRATSEDGGGLGTVLFADSIDFTADGRFAVYDALNQLRLAGGAQAFAWSIYALDLISEETLALVPPTAGLDVSYPALSQTNDGFLVFDAFDNDADASTITAMNLTTGATAEIATVASGYGAPSYSGDDGAIIYSQRDDTTASGFSLQRQPVGADRLTPAGAPTEWLADADYGVIYRRGEFSGPAPTPTATAPQATPTRVRTQGPPPLCIGDCNDSGIITVDELVRAVSIALGVAPLSQCAAADADHDDNVAIQELVAAVAGALLGCID